jgi:hypothetical protein
MLRIEIHAVGHMRLIVQIREFAAPVELENASECHQV